MKQKLKALFSVVNSISVVLRVLISLSIALFGIFYLVREGQFSRSDVQAWVLYFALLLSCLLIEKNDKIRNYVFYSAARTSGYKLPLSDMLFELSRSLLTLCAGIVFTTGFLSMLTAQGVWLAVSAIGCLIAGVIAALLFWWLFGLGNRAMDRVIERFIYEDPGEIRAKLAIVICVVMLGQVGLFLDLTD